MENSNHHVMIEALVKEIKEEMLSGGVDPYSFVSPSAYDTAWLAMIPAAAQTEAEAEAEAEAEDINNIQEYYYSNNDGQQPIPMFRDCIDWVLNNQAEEGYWGESDAGGNPTIDSLPATLASVIALKMWNVGIQNAHKGLAFIRENTEKLLGVEGEGHQIKQFPRWFAIVFPGMIELAHTVGLDLHFPDHLNPLLLSIFFQRQHIFDNEELVDGPYPPLLSYLEALPSSYVINNQQDITMHLSGDGSLFQSPSATASAFMATGNLDCLTYLHSLLRRCANNGVPPTYPMDEELIKLGLANQLQRLGLAQHFTQQIEDILNQVFRNYKNEEAAALGRQSNSSTISTVTQLHKDSLAFRLLRMHGYNISPWSFCWFLNNEGNIIGEIEKKSEYFSSVMLNVYRATDVMFPGEYEVEEARSFSRKVLQKLVIPPNDIIHIFDHQHENYYFTKPTTSNVLQTMIEHELSLPWIARLDHLEHRAWIEDNDMNALWAGKTSFHRFCSHKNEKLAQLAVAEYEFRQAIYKNEMAELKSWCLKWGLSDMGFGREKTSYCYFAVSASLSSQSQPYDNSDSDIRMMVAKSAIIITVADDFYDMEGSLNELNTLTDAVQRWDGKGLSGHAKTIFDALDQLVMEIAAKHLQHQGTDITSYLQQLWQETFASWLVEAKWSKSGCFPSLDEYIETGMTSIAAHTIVLPASCLLESSLPISKTTATTPSCSHSPPQYETLTKLLMLIPRLLNDTQSYKKEIEDGKMNYVMVYMKENPEAGMDESVAFVRELVEEKRKELLKHSLMDGLSDLSRASRHLHLSCVKVFQMFFNSANRYDSTTDLIQDIQKAIYIPPHFGISSNSNPLTNPNPNSSDDTASSKKEFQTTAKPTTTSHLFVHHPNSKYRSKRMIVRGYQASLPIARRGFANNVFITPNFRLSFA